MRFMLIVKASEDSEAGVMPPTELLEPFFFDFQGDLYGQTIEVALCRFIRPEEKYDTLDALKDQIARDCDEARRLLADIEG